MGDKTGIQWCDATWNPLRGCSRVSKGCEHCYAERYARRFSGKGQPYEGLVRIGKGGKPKAQWNGTVRFVEKRLADPLRWRKPRRVFVNSMSDLFHESVPFEQIAAIFGVMAASPRHAFQALTKRPARALEFSRWYEGESGAGATPLAALHEASVAGAFDRERVHRETERFDALDPRDIWPLPNVHLLVSVEDQATADERIPLLLQCPAAVRGVSLESMLGPVDLSPWLPDIGGTPVDCATCRRPKAPAGRSSAGAAGGGLCDWDCPGYPSDPRPGDLWPGEDRRDFGYPESLAGPRLDQVIVGGESGPGARAFDLAWGRSIVAQCKAAGVPCFMKQLGADARGRAGDPYLGGKARLVNDGQPMQFKHRKGADMSEWPPDLRVREFPNEGGRGETQ